MDGQPRTPEEYEVWAHNMSTIIVVLSVMRYERPGLIAPLPINQFVGQTIRCAYGDTPEAMSN
jgi:hypothetical protein